jgi:hypothetical protein
MMLYVDKKMLHVSLPDHESGPLPAGAGDAGHGVRDYPREGDGVREYPHDGHGVREYQRDGHGVREYQRNGNGGPAPARDQHRREVLLRVVRISGTLNKRLAL